MSRKDSEPFAIIADAHFHYVEGDYGLGQEHGNLAVRPLADTVKSLRVFNEANRALRFALDDIIARGIRHVVLLGDNSDDGQRETLRGLQLILSEYEKRFGLRFHALVGNHDIFGTDGRHRRKCFLNSSGEPCLLTSDPEDPAVKANLAVLSERMFCDGYPAGLRAFENAGFLKRPDDIFWESPSSAAGYKLSGLRFLASRRQIPWGRHTDASYLVEAIPGIWFLMIDANTFRLAEGPGEKPKVIDNTDTGWGAVPFGKPFLIDWIADVCARAKKLNKKVLAFSHYPAADPLRDTREDELSLLGETNLIRRIPSSETTEMIRETGIKVHFSGHMHVNDTACLGNGSDQFFNVSVPSLVAYPAAYKIVEACEDALAIKTVQIDEMELDPRITQRYQQEIHRNPIPRGTAFIECRTYAQFLDLHSRHLVTRRHLRRDWPAQLSEIIRNITLFELLLFAKGHFREPPLNIEPASAKEWLKSEWQRKNGLISSDGLGPIDKTSKALQNITMLSFMEDWYKLRMGGELAICDISRDRLQYYRIVSEYIRGCIAQHTDRLMPAIKNIFSIFDKYCDGSPSRDFTISIGDGAI